MKLKKSVKKTIIAIISILAVFVVIGLLIGVILYVKKLNRFEYKDHLDEVVITVDQRNITLREFGYYVYQIEGYAQEQALVYNPDNPVEWWNTHFSSGPDSQFVCDYAKDVAVNLCIADEIFYEEAKKQGLELNEDGDEKVKTDTQEMINKMDSVQMSSTGLDEKIISEFKKKQLLSATYAEFLVNTIDFSEYDEDPYKLINWDGAYYQEEILPKHSVQINDELLGKITFGKITVNYQ